MITPLHTLRWLPLSALALAAQTALATNGMNMEGYGPISTGMGGASQAADHGTAGMAQNPATLGLMAEGTRVDVAIGQLGPKVNSRVSGCCSADSGGTSYVMPAIGFARRNGALTWGLGVFAQGGMGTEYDANTFLAMGSGHPVRSELGVGRLLLPVAFQVNPDLTLGASLDYVWATLDMRMAASGAQLGGLVTAASGNLGSALPMLGGAPWARIDFTDGSKFSGAAKSSGWAYKLGATWRALPTLMLGASYQSKTNLSDMKTDAKQASMSAPGGFGDSGRMTVVDFQWPDTTAVGLSCQAAGGVTLAAEVKRIGWSAVMKNFRLRYDSAGMGGSVSFALPQNWSDQTVTSIGASWDMTPAITLRAGYSRGANPVPSAYVHPLFPATVEDHYTAGLGYRLSAGSEINVSLSMVPSATVTNGQGVTVSHKQTNAQLMYSMRF